MRLIAAFFTLLMLTATVLAGIELSTGLAAPSLQTTPVTTASGSDTSNLIDGAAADRMIWPTLFGVPQPPKPPAPQPVAAVEPVAPQTPPKPPKPPLASLGYELKGVVRSGTAIWGLVSHPSGDKIIKVGDALRDGVDVARIDAQGLWVSRDGDAPELLGFVE